MLEISPGALVLQVTQCRGIVRLPQTSGMQNGKPGKTLASVYFKKDSLSEE
jgi:hypothetical protein